MLIVGVLYIDARRWRIKSEKQLFWLFLNISKTFWLFYEIVSKLLLFNQKHVSLLRFGFELHRDLLRTR